MRNAVSRLLLLLGILTALFGFGIDYLLPGTTPGLNIPQLLLIVVGLSLALVAFRFSRADLRRRPSTGSRRGFTVILLLTFVTLLLLELILAVAGTSTYVLREMPHGVVRIVEATMCDEGGCRADYEFVTEACARGEQMGRVCIVNPQGFADDEEFVAREDFLERYKVLILGDSFAQGYAADVGSSFVETIEARFAEVVVWNAAFTTTGTNQAVASFEMLGPTLRPDLTILGFYMNDFTDNLMPVDSWYVTEDRNGNQAFIRPYRIDEWGNAIRLDDTSAQYFVAHGAYPPRNEFERFLGSSRLGTLALRFRDSIAMLQYDDRLFTKSVEATGEYLSLLRDLAASQSSELLVMLIPDRTDLTAVGERYKTSIKLMEELVIPYMDLAVILDASEDYAPPPDIHWNSAGHQKVGALLGECIRRIIDGGSLDNCDHVIVP